MHWASERGLVTQPLRHPAGRAWAMAGARERAGFASSKDAVRDGGHWTSMGHLNVTEQCPEPNSPDRFYSLGSLYQHDRRQQALFEQ